MANASISLPRCASEEHSSRSSLGAWFKARSLPLAAMVFLVAYGFSYLHEYEESLWRICYVTAANRMAAGEPIHQYELHAYAYPPAMAMLVMPLAKFSPWASQLGWYGVNVVALWCLTVVAWRLVGGGRIVGVEGRPLAALLIGLLLSARFVMAPLENTQSDLVIAALVLAGCYQVGRGGDFLGGVLLGLGAAMKCTPLLFAPYLLWRAKWKSAGLLIAVALGLNLMPDIFWPQTSGESYLANWQSTFLRDAGTWAPGEWHSEQSQNQSLAGTLNRLATRVGYSPVPENAVTPGATTSTAPLLRMSIYGVALLLLGTTAWSFGRHGRLETTSGTTRSSTIVFPRFAWECSAVLCLMLLVSPMSSKAHYVVLILPCFLVAKLAVERRSGWVLVLLGVLAVTGPLTAKGLIGREWGDATLDWNFPTLFAAALLVSCWLMLRRDRQLLRRDRQPQSGTARIDHGASAELAV